MKSSFLFVLFGVAVCLQPARPADESGFWSKLFPPLPSSDRGPVACVFYVSTISGTVECTADGRIFDLKRGDKILARGARIKTFDNAKVALVFSNQTTLFLNPKTELRVDKFEQEPFSPNNNLLIEPSNSQMLLYIEAGQLVIATPQLLSGTRMVLETPHAGIFILNGQSGGEKGFLEVTPKQTHFAMIQGKADANVRERDGQLGNIGETLVSGQQCFVKYTLNKSGDSGQKASISVSAGGAIPAAATAGIKPPEPAAAPSAAGETAGIRPALGEFQVAKASGTVECTVDGRIVPLKAGDAFPSEGTAVRTSAGGRAAIVLSDLTTLTLAANTELRIVRYDQEGFEPTDNVELEPSTTNAQVMIRRGTVDIRTPQLLSGTTMLLESPHGVVSLLPVQTGGDEATVHVTAKQTECHLRRGKAVATPRGPDGSLVSLGENLGPGQMAIVKPTVANTQQAAPAPVAAGEFRVARLSGRAACLSGQTSLPLKEGDVIAGAGSVLSTGPGSTLTVVLSDLTRLTLRERTELRFDRYLQAPFGSASDPDLEPSAAQFETTLKAGSIAVETPQLLSESNLTFHTPHGAVHLLAAATGGDRADLLVSAEQTDLKLLAGRASARSIGADGQLVATGEDVTGGQEAVIKPVVGSKVRTGVLAEADRLTRVAVQPAPEVPPGASLTIESAAARVLRVSGSASAIFPHQVSRVELAPGARLPVGSVVETGPGSEVYLQPYPGAVGVLKAGGRLTVEKLEFLAANGSTIKRTIIFDLKKGTLVSMIDPAKHNVDSYAVRTPKGLAKAQGTSFTVTVNDQDSEVATTADSVTFTGTDGTTYTVNAGSVSVTPAGGQPQAPVPLSQAIAADPAFAGVLQAAVATVSTIVQNNIGGMPAGPAANLLSQVVGVAAAAIPSQAGAFASEAIAAVTAPGSATAGSANAAAAAVTAAAVTAAGSQTNQIVASCTQAAPAFGQTIAAAAGQVSGGASAPGSAAGAAQVTAVEVLSLIGAESSGNAGANGNGAGGANGNSGANGSAGSNQSTTVSIVQVGAGESAAATTSTASPQATSITVTQLSGSLVNEINEDLAAASAAQASVTFNTGTSSNSSGGTTTTVTPTPTTPSQLPADNTASPSSVGTGT